ncbi:hypothetical protein ABZ722_33275 [Streptomyces longwoodensis]|jgi:hypothetical protein|uniref:LPXTG cell wall anchor domain-containing protein n=1 Tax=Streptomyces lasalocidi TaxID=324833 RepID=A0A4U5WCM1_STRLS|nr:MULTISPECIES: hypothetical protein [Streptomyces]MCX4999822.1 hypothetical protein [Streptomyces longwoodensis]TKS99398.1 hypothetical protein E4U91_04200 [Streptomyces lasalocidi]WRY87061.1 hypothetical protein OG481_00345 [Streptomyces longwoodensis]WTI48553.1 hypothetical protein OG547_30525 [Streptomyces longwoodensis]WUC61283.1 hypothetical protein OHA09_31410 [Streptomyces longwoodensis]
MRSVRIILATAVASASLAVAAPAAFAAGGDWDHDSSSYSKESKEHGSSTKEHDAGGSHDGPRGGMHTGGGALTMTKGDDPGARDPKFDPETYKDKDSDHGGSSWTKDEGGESSSWTKEKDNEGWSGDHEKPRGGMHTGGGALAAPTVTAGGLAVLALAGTGLYAARRKKSAHGLA